MRESFWKRFLRKTDFVQPERSQVSVEPVAPTGEGTVRMRLVFHGRVQGVGFRFMAVTLARPRGLTGWVKNEFDGTVSMEVQGSGAQINTLVEELHHQRFIRISQVDSERISVDTHETSFREMQ
jgi:acylphosphatase